MMRDLATGTVYINSPGQPMNAPPASEARL